MAETQLQFLPIEEGDEEEEMEHLQFGWEVLDLHRSTAARAISILDKGNSLLAFKSSNELDNKSNTSLYPSESVDRPHRVGQLPMHASQASEQYYLAEIEEGLFQRQIEGQDESHSIQRSSSESSSIVYHHGQSLQSQLQEALRHTLDDMRGNGNSQTAVPWEMVSRTESEIKRIVSQYNELQLVTALKLRKITERRDALLDSLRTCADDLDKQAAEVSRLTRLLATVAASHCADFPAALGMDPIAHAALLVDRRRRWRGRLAKLARTYAVLAFGVQAGRALAAWYFLSRRRCGGARAANRQLRKRHGRALAAALATMRAEAVRGRRGKAIVASRAARRFASMAMGIVRDWKSTFLEARLERALADGVRAAHPAVRRLQASEPRENRFLICLKHLICLKGL
jgi:hypothetical protein